MENILKLSIPEMTNLSLNCKCGKKHKIDIQKIILGNNIDDEILKIFTCYKNNNIFMISDVNTYQAYGENIYKIIINLSLNVKQLIYDETPALIPDEKSLIKAFIEIDPSTSLIVAIGSGTINDISKFLSYKFNIPYIIFATAPSMDGYASSVSSLIINNFKTTYKTVYPSAIIADYSVLTNSPLNMIQAGFGDIIGKFTALADWELSKNLNNEYYCNTVAGLTHNALKKCCLNASGLLEKNKNTIASIFEALILSGIAMGMAGSSRPASGAEHHLSHYWELEAIKNHEEHPLHGSMVGVATLIISDVYRMVDEINKLPINIPKTEEITNLLITAGCIYDPAGLNINKDVFKKSILNGMNIRPERFTILQYANKLGILKKIAKRLLEKYY